MSDNWVVQNLENALNTWNEKLAEIWTLITQSPENFKGGAIWNVIVDIHGALQAIGLALLVLFFVVGVMRTCGNFAEVKRPEQALKLFIRFALAKGAVTIFPYKFIFSENTFFSYYNTVQFFSFSLCSFPFVQTTTVKKTSRFYFAKKDGTEFSIPSFLYF